jgi:hypothetical protein
MRSHLNTLVTASLLTTDQTASLLQLHPGSLRSARCRKSLDLPYVRVGRVIRYRPEDVAAFIEANRPGGL